MSTPAHQYCTRWPRKARYLSAFDAEMALIRVQADPHPEEGEMPRASYRCPYCEAWHLTSKPQR